MIPVSYWLVNQWMTLSARDEAAGLDALVAAGLWGVNIEVTGWPAKPHLENPEATCIALRRLVVACRARGLNALLSVYNDNGHLDKHGNNPINPALHREAMQVIVGHIKALGPDNLIVQPTGETKTPTGVWLEGHCRQQLAGFALCYNGGSRPSKAPIGYRHFAYHVTGPTQRPPAKALCVTDTTGILSWLTNGMGDFHADLFNPARINQYVRTCLQWGNPCHLYAFGHRAVDLDSIRAISHP